MRPPLSYQILNPLLAMVILYLNFQYRDKLSLDRPCIKMKLLSVHVFLPKDTSFLPTVDLVVEHEGDCVIGKENYHLTCSAKNVLPQDGIKFEWCKDVGGKLTPVRELHEDGISTKDTGQLTTLSFNPLKLSHDGKYSCRYTRRRRLICCLRMKAESSKQLSVDVAT